MQFETVVLTYFSQEHKELDLLHNALVFVPKEKQSINYRGICAMFYSPDLEATLSLSITHS